MATSLTDKLEALERENAQLKQRIEELEARTPSGLAGWLVTVPNDRFSGNTAGVVFRAGKAFIPQDSAGNGARKAAEMQNDFGYTVRYVEDWQQMDPASTEQISRSMIDIVGAPEVR